MDLMDHGDCMNSELRTKVFLLESFFILRLWNGTLICHTHTHTRTHTAGHAKRIAALGALDDCELHALHLAPAVQEDDQPSSV